MNETLETLKKEYISYRLINYDPLDTEERINPYHNRSIRVVKDIERIKEKSFSSLLSEFVNVRFEKDSDFYSAIEMSRQLFSKIINHKYYQPTRETVMKCCIGLELGERDAQLLMESAGYGFSRAKELDLIIKFCIAKRVYDKELIDALLIEHKQKAFFSVK
jgi:hypothetical protein